MPVGKYSVEIGKGKRVREGTDITIIAWGAMVAVAEKAAEEVIEKGISCEIIDLRTLYPIDREIIAESVQEMMRAVIVHEAHSTGAR